MTKKFGDWRLHRISTT